MKKLFLYCALALVPLGYSCREQPVRRVVGLEGGEYCVGRFSDDGDSELSVENEGRVLVLEKLNDRCPFSINLNTEQPKKGEKCRFVSYSRRDFNDLSEAMNTLDKCKRKLSGEIK